MMFLINKGVDVNAKCGQGYSVLDWATNEGYTRLIKALKKAGAKNTPQYFKDSKK
jgi:ankyrin repeat protein